MALRPITDVLQDAVRAASHVRAMALTLRDAPVVAVAGVAATVNGMQACFDDVKPLLRFSAADIQTAAASLYGSVGPGDVLVTIAGAQAAGQALVARIVGEVYPPGSPVHSFDPVRGVYKDINVSAAARASMVAEIDALISALDPIAGG